MAITSTEKEESARENCDLSTFGPQPMLLCVTLYSPIS